MPLDLATLLGAINGTPVTMQVVATTTSPQLPADRLSVATAEVLVESPSSEQDFLHLPDGDFGTTYRPRREPATMPRHRWSRPSPTIRLIAIDRPEEPARWYWWRQPAPGWSEGALILYNIARDETFLIPLREM